MNSLDPRSLIAMGALMTVLMTAILVLLRRHYPPHIRGLGDWAAASSVWLLASFLFGCRGQLPASWAMVLANSLLLQGAIFYCMGCRRFYGHVRQWRLWAAVLLAETLAFSWFTYARPSFGMQLVVITASMLGTYGATLYFLLRHGDRRLPQHLVELVLGLHMAVLVLRLVTASAGHSGDNLLQPSLYQNLYVGSYVLTVLLLTVGAVLMASDRLTREMEYLASHDPLTQALNRRALAQRGAQELSRSQRHGHALALMMIDLDHFKQVNDHHGHLHGDAVLQHFARQAKAQLRRADTLGRWGGEEFMVLLPETNQAQAQATAARIHAALAQGHALDCRLSIGLATWQAGEDSLDAMIARADAALYQAKEQGRNRTCTL